MAIMSGDDDTVCSTMGTQQFIWDLGYNEFWEYWKPWTVAGDMSKQLAGMTTLFRVLDQIPGSTGLRFTTVHGAGHMVPATRPDQALDVLRRFQLRHRRDNLR